MIRGDTLLVLDLGLDIVDGVGGLDLEGDGLAREAAILLALDVSVQIFLHFRCFPIPPIPLFSQVWIDLRLDENLHLFRCQ